MKHYSKMSFGELLEFADNCHKFWCEQIDFAHLNQNDPEFADELTIDLAGLICAIDLAKERNDMDAVLQRAIIFQLDRFKEYKDKIVYKNQRFYPEDLGKTFQYIGETSSTIEKYKCGVLVREENGLGILKIGTDRFYGSTERKKWTLV